MKWLTELYLRMFTPREEEDEGAAMVEYALLVALIAVAAIVAVTGVGDAIIAKFGEVADGLT